MTKTLTEQWREGTLPDGKYYIKLEPNFTERYDVGYSEGGEFALYNIEDIEEVLAPVPSYERIKDLDRLEQFCELVLAGEKQEWESIVKRGDRKEMAKWLNERKNKTVDRIEKKLEIATKALKIYDNKLNWDIRGVSFMKYNKGFTLARKALKEMEGVK